jgi:hypothetical protein
MNKETEIAIEQEREKMIKSFAIIVGGFLLCCGVLALASPKGDNWLIIFN